jgi:hypothetical protein
VGGGWGEEVGELRGSTGGQWERGGGGVGGTTRAVDENRYYKTNKQNVIKCEELGKK